MSGDRTAERLAEALPGILRNPVGKASRPLSEVIAELLPVVDAIADERARQQAAEMIQIAADGVRGFGDAVMVDWLLRRVIALRGTPVSHPAAPCHLDRTTATAVTEARTPTAVQRHVMDLLDIDPGRHPLVRLSLADWARVSRVAAAIEGAA